MTNDLSPASLILGVKQVPIKELLPNKNYIFFSHVIKAQPENMPMLDDILKKNIRYDSAKMCSLMGLILPLWNFGVGAACLITKRSLKAPRRVDRVWLPSESMRALQE